MSVFYPWTVLNGESYTIIEFYKQAVFDKQLYTMYFLTHMHAFLPISGLNERLSKFIVSYHIPVLPVLFCHTYHAPHFNI